MFDVIPVIGTAVVNGPHWVYRLLTSIDHPVETFVVFNNNGRGEITKELDGLLHVNNPFVKNIRITHMPANIGCSGAWNFIIKSFMLAPYWIISNHDIMFLPGFLKSMLDMAKDPETGFVAGRGCDIFLIKDWVVDRCGLFDENCYPAYCEDADYNVRMKLSGVKEVNVPELRYCHGYAHDGQDGSRTWRDDQKIGAVIHQIHELNKLYLHKKWNESWQGHVDGDVFPSPFNLPNFPVYFSKYELGFNRRKHMGF